jgi:hypothetical protein
MVLEFTIESQACFCPFYIRLSVFLKFSCLLRFNVRKHQDRLIFATNKDAISFLVSINVAYMNLKIK